MNINSNIIVRFQVLAAASMKLRIFSNIIVYIRILLVG
jgi:hypothetical protein